MIRILSLSLTKFVAYETKIWGTTYRIKRSFCEEKIFLCQWLNVCSMFYESVHVNFHYFHLIEKLFLRNIDFNKSLPKFWIRVCSQNGINRIGQEVFETWNTVWKNSRRVKAFQKICLFARKVKMMKNPSKQRWYGSDLRVAQEYWSSVVSTSSFTKQTVSLASILFL